MTKYQDIHDGLTRPFTPEQIKHRPQGGRQLAYIDARDVAQRLDEVVGFENWWDNYLPGEHSVRCELTIRLPDGSTVTKVGQCGDPVYGFSVDEDNTRETEAFRRAAVAFGIGKLQHKAKAIIAGVPNFPGYAVGDDGSVFSNWERGRWHRRTLHWKQLATPLSTDGYPRFNMGIDGKKQHTKVHNLVMAVFVGPKPAGLVVRHLDGNKANNRLSNLAYGTYQENSHDAIRHGTWNHGTKVPCAKLTDDDVREIRRLHKQGMTQRELAARFGVNPATIHPIVHGTAWKHVKEDN